LSLEIVGLKIFVDGCCGGSTMMVSSSTDVASVPVWPSVPEGDDTPVPFGDSYAELGESSMLAKVEIFKRDSSVLKKGCGLAFLDDLDGDGDSNSSSRLRFRGVRLGSTDDDFRRGDSAFLNLDNDLGVLFGT
jgi:hypothetical protein